MDHDVLSSDLIARLRTNEHLLLRRYGVRLHIDKIAIDGKGVLCCAVHGHRSFFRSARSTEELIDLAYAALVPLHLISLSSLISPLPTAHKFRFPSILPEDPFGIQRAMRVVALAEAPRSLEAIAAPNM